MFLLYVLTALFVELSKVEDAFVKILGVKPRYFRPPYGNINDNVLNVLSERGYTSAFMSYIEVTY